MSSPRFGSRRQGLTLIEMLVVMAVLSLLLTLALPSFQGTLARQRLQGFTSELLNDLQQLRSEAVRQRAEVRLSLGTNCYVMHPASVAVGSDCRPSSAGALTLKEVRLDETLRGLSLSPSSGFMAFDFIRGMRGSSSLETLSVQSMLDGSQLRITLGLTGRLSVCSAPQAHSGYPAC